MEKLYTHITTFVTYKTYLFLGDSISRKIKVSRNSHICSRWVTEVNDFPRWIVEKKFIVFPRLQVRSYQIITRKEGFMKTQKLWNWALLCKGMYLPMLWKVFIGEIKICRRLNRKLRFLCTSECSNIVFVILQCVRSRLKCLRIWVQQKFICTNRVDITPKLKFCERNHVEVLAMVTKQMVSFCSATYG